MNKICQLSYFTIYNLNIEQFSTIKDNFINRLCYQIQYFAIEPIKQQKRIIKIFEIIQKNKMPIRESKSMNIKKKKSTNKLKEKGFILNCVNQNQSKLPFYDSTGDKYLKYFFIRTCSSSGQIKNKLTKKGRVMHNNKQNNEVLMKPISSQCKNVHLPAIKYKQSGKCLNKQEFDDFLRLKRSELQLPHSK